MFTLLLAAISGGPALAQLASDPAADFAGAREAEESEGRFEGAPVRAVDIVRGGDGLVGVEPLTGRDLQLALNNLRTEVGSAFSERVIREDVARLSRLGRFGRIDAFVQPLEGGGVRVTYRVELEQIIRDVQSAGNRRVSDQEITGVAGLLTGTPVDQFQIDRAVRRIEDLYEERGYSGAEVTVDEEQLRENGVVLFKIREGQRIKIKSIRLRPLRGRLELPEREIRREVETRTSGIFRRGEVDETQLDLDEAAIRDFYRDNGFLDARVSSTIEPATTGDEAIVTFIIDQGRRYTLRSIEVRIADPERSPFTPAQVIGHMTIRPGETFGDAAVEESIEAVRMAFGRLGHVGPLETPRQRADPGIVIDTVELRDPDEPLVDLVLEVEAGPAYKTGLVRIAGNDLTRHEVIRREIQVMPGGVLDLPALQESRRDIRRTRLFDPAPPDGGVRVTIQDPLEADLTVRDVLFEVEETNTGSFDIGAAVSSDAGLLGRIALTQRNFDVSDTPDSFGEFITGRAFRGDGQTFQIEAQPGTELQQYSVSLAEPSLFETDYSGSVRGFFRTREFDEFDERRFGGGFAFGRRFGTRWNGLVRVRLESVDISEIDENLPEDFFLFEDETRIVGIGPALTRTTTDDRLFPTRGTRTEVSVEQVLGTTEFTEIAAEHIVYVPVYEDFRGRRTVVSLRGETRFIPQDDENVPVFERFFLGGQSFRGFAFRTVSPRGNSRLTGAPSDEPVGGTFLFFTSTEVRQPLIGNNLFGAAFVDAGTVRSDFGLEDWRVSVGVGLRIRIPGLSPAPLAFDLGFPILKQFGDEERVFSFSLDLPF